MIIIASIITIMDSFLSLHNIVTSKAASIADEMTSSSLLVYLACL